MGLFSLAVLGTHSWVRTRGCQSCRDSGVVWCPHPFLGMPSPCLCVPMMCLWHSAYTLLVTESSFSISWEAPSTQEFLPFTQKVPHHFPPLLPVLFPRNSFYPSLSREQEGAGGISEGMLKDLNRCVWDEHCCRWPLTEGTRTITLSCGPGRACGWISLPPKFLWNRQ